MEKSTRIIPLIYGYAVCLTAIIVTLISVSMIIGAIFSLNDPVRSNNTRYFGPPSNVSSFESYKIDVLTGRGQTAVSPEGEKSDKGYTPSDAELRTSYEATKADHVAGLKLEAKKSITNGIILILIAVALFVTHWRWLTKLNRASASR